MDVTGRRCTVVDVEGGCQVLDFDWLVVASGSVTRLLSVPGVGEHAHGFKTDWLTDLVTERQLVQFGMVPEQGVRLTDCDRLPAAGRVG